MAPAAVEQFRDERWITGNVFQPVREAVRPVVIRADSHMLDTSHGPLTLTCSFGASTWEAGDTIDSLLKRADVALYAAKTGGRNRVIAANARRPGSDSAPAGGHLRSIARG